MKHVRFPAGDSVPALGLGTWHMGQDLSHFNAEVAALRHGIELGMTLIDTAEMYADGGAEQVVGAAIKGRREGLFIVSKVLPHHASAAGTIAACEQSLARLGSDYIDLYLLHWPGQHALQESIRGFETLQQGGLIGHPVLTEIGRRHDSDAAAVALAWAIRRDDVIAIPKAGDLGHVRANRAAAEIVLSAADLAAIDDAVPPPTRRQHLEVL
jgi:diketogulonate reductase-like aldo/keto reductase